jgi:hypothetical protein
MAGEGVFCFQSRGKRGFDMPALHDEHPRLAALYDLACGWSEDRDFYLWLAKGGAKSILDLGCGTGPICDAYAAGGHDDRRQSFSTDARYRWRQTEWLQHRVGRVLLTGLSI